MSLTPCSVGSGRQPPRATHLGDSGNQAGDLTGSPLTDRAGPGPGVVRTPPETVHSCYCFHLAHDVSNKGVKPRNIFFFLANGESGQ